MIVHFLKKNRGGNSKIDDFGFPEMRKNHNSIIIKKREKCKYFLHSTKILAPRNFTDYIELLEQHGISGDAALLTLAWECFRGMNQ